jgi:hypothetical protein
MANPAAPYEEIYRAAAHEAGHGMISAHLGIYVYFAAVHRDGSGITDMDCPSGPIDDLRITVAGYITEALLEGEVPTYEGMTLLVSNEDDLGDVENIMVDGRINHERAIQDAFDFVISYFEIPSRRARLEHIAHKLTRTRYLVGAYFNGDI